MKKEILFIIPSLSAGGGEKSLVNLLNQVDYSKYNVDLFLLEHNGIFMKYLPKEVNVLPLPKSFKSFSLPLFKSLVKILQSGNWKLFQKRIMFSVRNRQISDTSRKEQYTWKYLSCALDKLDKTYDTAIGFLEKTSTYFCVDKVDAIKKIGWVHIDYDKLGMDPEFDISYFRKLDNIITVSEECSNIFSNRFPCQRDKIKVIYNIVSPRTIYKLAEDSVRVIEKKEGVTNLLTVGRLHYQKGYEMAVEACEILVNKGYNVKWFVIGEGEDREKITKLIDDHGMQNHFILLGLKSNPYPYINQADIYVQPSRFEGKSIAIDEAKILRKPIIVTNFSTAKDQIVNRETGLIVDMNPLGISNGIEEVISDKSLIVTLYNNLDKLNLSTEKEVEKLYSII